MFNTLTEVIYDADGFDLSQFCSFDMRSGLPVQMELTEEELQEIEQRAEDWYLSRM